MSAFKCTKFSFGVSCLLILGCILIVMAVTLPILIESKIQSQAKEQVLMGTGNKELWGIIPGQSHVDMHRDYYLYNLTNPDDFLYNQAQPEFVEVGPYTYNEFQNYTNTNFITRPNSSLEEITYDFWQWYTHKSGNPLDTVNSLNLGSLGVWHQAKSAPKKSMALQVFGNLVLGLEAELMTVTISQGLQSFLKDQKTAVDVLFKPTRIPQELWDPLWFDVEYGLGDWKSRRIWVKAIVDGSSLGAGASFVLRDHFHLSLSNMNALLSGPMSQWVSMTQSLVKNWYCANRTTCDTLYLIALQITQQGMTMNPPPGSAPTESMMTTNDTLRTPPEMSIYLKSVFLQKPGLNVSDYQNVTFSPDWAYRLFSHSSNPNEWLTDPDLLLHIGNLDFIFQAGARYEISSDITEFEGVRQRFNLDTLQQTHVFYSYLNYMVEEFAAQKSSNGTSGEAFMASTVSLMMAGSFSTLSDYLLPELLSGLMLHQIQINATNCLKMFNSSGFNESFSQSICSSDSAFNDSRWFNDSSAFKTLLGACSNREGYYGLSFRAKTSLSKIDLLTLCEANNPITTGFPYLKTWAEQRIHSFYNCTTNNHSCSKNELARRQWGNSTITQNPLYELYSNYPPSLSVSDWNPNLFPKPFEYLAVLNAHSSLATNGTPIMGFNDSTTKKLLSYDRLFSNSIRYLFTNYKNNNFQAIKDNYSCEDPKALQNYLKYIMIEFGLQGIVKSRTVNDILFGYQDPLLKIAASTNPVLGGDPSINPTVALVTNSTYEQALNFPQSVYSGKGDVSRTREYSSVYGYNYAVFKDSAFDGNKTYDIYVNPWKEKVPLKGTDSFCNPPDSNTDSKPHIYMADVCYGGPAEFSKKVDHNGLNTLRYETGRSFMENKTDDAFFGKFYMDRWNQALNATSIKKMPVFVTKFRYLDLDAEPIKDLIVYTNANKTEKMKADPFYQIHFDVEPYTGGAVSASLNIMMSFEYKKDELFSNEKYVFLPALGVVRPGTWSDSAIDQVYGDLMLAIKFKKVLFIAGLSVGIVFILIGCALIVVKWRAHSKRKSETLLEKCPKDTDIETNKEDNREDINA